MQLAPPILPTVLDDKAGKNQRISVLLSGDAMKIAPKAKVVGEILYAVVCLAAIFMVVAVVLHRHTALRGFALLALISAAALKWVNSKDTVATHRTMYPSRLRAIVWAAATGYVLLSCIAVFAPNFNLTGYIERATQSAPAPGGDWVLVDSYKSYYGFVKPRSVQRTGDNIAFWYRFYLPPNNTQGFAYVQGHGTADCKKRDQLTADAAAPFDKRGNQLAPFRPLKNSIDIVGHPYGGFARLLAGACGIDAPTEKLGD
jgi:hypothetical protein